MNNITTRVSIMRKNSKMKITDPYLKERVHISGEPKKSRTWLIWLLLIAIIAGGGYYFYPQIQPHAAPVIAQIQVQIQQLQQQLIAVFEKEEVVETIESTEITPEPVIALPDESAVAEIPVTTILPHETPTEIISEVSEELNPEPPAEVEVAEPAPEPDNNLNSAQITELVEQAQVQIRRQRFTQPEGDNANATYQALLQLGAKEQAEQILNSMLEWYETEIQQNITDGRIAFPVDRNAALVYRSLAEIAPEHPTTAKLLENILLALKTRVDLHLQRDNVFTPRNDNLHINVKLMYDVAADHPITQASIAEAEAKMLALATQQIAQRKYTTPAEDSAYNTYSVMLRMNPGSLQAKKGLKELADIYYDLANQRIRQNRRAGALTLIERGLGVDPEHEQLLALQQRLNN